jgi:hypothetical protein
VLGARTGSGSTFAKPKATRQLSADDFSQLTDIAMPRPDDEGKHDSPLPLLPSKSPPPSAGKQNQKRASLTSPARTPSQSSRSGKTMTLKKSGRSANKAQENKRATFSKDISTLTTAIVGMAERIAAGPGPAPAAAGTSAAVESLEKRVSSMEAGQQDMKTMLTQIMERLSSK